MQAYPTNVKKSLVDRVMGTNIMHYPPRKEKMCSKRLQGSER